MPGNLVLEVTKTSLAEREPNPDKVSDFLDHFKELAAKYLPKRKVAVVPTS